MIKTHAAQLPVIICTMHITTYFYYTAESMHETWVAHIKLVLSTHRNNCISLPTGLICHIYNWMQAHAPCVLNNAWSVWDIFQMLKYSWNFYKLESTCPPCFKHIHSEQCASWKFSATIKMAKLNQLVVHIGHKPAIIKINVLRY